MTERSAKWKAWSGLVLFAISMVVPPQAWPEDNMRQDFGFQLASLSFLGAMEGSVLCMIGFAANVSFLLGALLLIIRVARGRPWPTFRFIFQIALFSAIAMIVSRIWLVSPYVAYYFAPGFLLWLGGAVSLAIGCWNLRHESTSKMPHGFDVIPLATVASTPTAVTPKPVDDSPRA